MSNPRYVVLVGNYHFTCNTESELETRLSKITSVAPPVIYEQSKLSVNRKWSIETPQEVSDALISPTKTNVDEVTSSIARWTPQEVTNCLNLHRSGKSYDEIASIMGRTKKSVSQKLLKLKSENKRDRANRVWSENEIKTCLTLTERGFSTEYCANYLGRTKQAIYAKLHELRNPT